MSDYTKYSTLPLTQTFETISGLSAADQELNSTINTVSLLTKVMMTHQLWWLKSEKHQWQSDSYLFLIIV